MIRRAAVATMVAAALVLAPAGGARAQGEDDNTAIAVNTEDGATVFRLAFSVRKVANGVVDQSNTAVALASCTECRTIALAFQVVLVNGDTDVVTPENRAVAVNVECQECLTYASATQVVLGFDGAVRFTSEGRKRLNALHRSLRELEDTASSLTDAELVAAIRDAEEELLSILSEELVEPGPPAWVTTTTSSTTEPTSTTGPTSTTDGTSSDGTTTTSVTPPTATTATTTATSVDPSTSTTEAG